MSVRNVQELREWLQQRDEDGERLIKNDWWVWTNALGDLCVQNPTCQDMSDMFCCGGQDSNPHKEVRHVGGENQGGSASGVR